MDWLELLLVALFFLLPLLQGLWGRKEGGDESPPGEPARAEDAPPAFEDDRPVLMDSDEELHGWSAEWGEWPGAEEIAGREVVEKEEAEALAELQEELHPEETPEAVRVSTPVVSMEPLRVDRTAARERTLAPSSPPTRPARRPPAPLAASLHRASEVRRAVILAEVLGPPRSLRPPDDLR